MATQTSSSPSGNLVAVTPHDTTLLTGGVTRGLYIGGAGNVTVLTQDDQVVTLTALAIGVIHPLRVKRINATLTTATSIIAVY